MMNLDWLAGFVDGEGSFNISFNARSYKGRWNVRFDPRVMVAIKHGADEILPAIQEILGCGKIYSRGESCRAWQTTSLQEAISVTELLLPHLILKKPIAERFLEACRLLPKSRKGIASCKGERHLTFDVANAVTEIALTLNEGGRSFRYRNPEAVSEWKEKLRLIYN